MCSFISDTLRGMDLPFPALWLRDNCPCPACRDPRSGQKLHTVADLDGEVSVAASAESGGTVSVHFTDGHVARFERDWLDRHRDVDAAGDGRTETGKDLWDRVAPPEAGWAGFRADPRPALDALWRTGFVLLRDTPVAPGTVLAVARTFGHVRTTNYGELFDVRIERQPGNLAFTSRAIAPHTDNPYRDPVPTLQLLHCLRAAADGGGESGLVDGFRAAVLLRDRHPEHFAVLSRMPATFAWGRLSAQRPMIGVDEIGRIREIRYNNRSLQPLAGPREGLEAFYAAYRAFDALLNRAGAMVTFGLGPGDCVIFDNTRVLHARTAFDPRAAADRHLQGCYADLDAVQWLVARTQVAAG
ncbi:TauD/TfdA family dioxygenase [Dactylosporangium sp. McL0621]|uniref:TauD/TfdA family dioxygenase n=1 Tax=Dactylosporangium sp. McL0621 TaxID=3415678 RepID=UPI003CEB680B